MSLPHGWEWVFLAVVLLLLFGGRKLPEMARSLGASIKSFRKEMSTAEQGGDQAQEAAAPGSQVPDTQSRRPSEPAAPASGTDSVQPEGGPGPVTPPGPPPPVIPPPTSPPTAGSTDAGTKPPTTL